MKECLVCYEEYKDEEIAPQICLEDCQAVICRNCIGQHFQSIIESGFDGACPKMKCYACPRIIPKAGWAPLVAAHLPELFERRAKLLMSIQCGSCHTRRDAFIPSTLALSQEREAALLSILAHEEDPNRPGVAIALAEDHNNGGGSSAEEYESMREQYERGEIREADFFDYLGTVFPTLQASLEGSRGQETESREESRIAMMKFVLESFYDDERRSCLHLRYLRFFPHIRTTCCARWHCFKCKIKDYHVGQTCDEYQASQNSEYLTCGQCGIYLVKGDGCSSVSCVCGFYFNWNTRMEEMQIIRRQEILRSRFPDLSVEAAVARILFDFEASPVYRETFASADSIDHSDPRLPEEVRVALETFNSRRTEVNQEMAALFFGKFAGMSPKLATAIVTQTNGSLVDFFLVKVKVNYLMRTFAGAFKNSDLALSTAASPLPIYEAVGALCHHLVPCTAASLLRKVPNHKAKMQLREHGPLLLGELRFLAERAFTSTQPTSLSFASSVISVLESAMESEQVQQRHRPVQRERWFHTHNWEPAAAARVCVDLLVAAEVRRSILTSGSEETDSLNGGMFGLRDLFDEKEEEEDVVLQEGKEEDGDDEEEKEDQLVVPGLRKKKIRFFTQAWTDFPTMQTLRDAPPSDSLLESARCFYDHWFPGELKVMTSYENTNPNREQRVEAAIKYNMVRALAFSFGNNCVRDIENFEADLFQDRFHDFIEQSSKRKAGFLQDKVSGKRLSQIQADVSQCKLTRADVALNMLLAPWFGSVTCRRTFTPLEREGAFFWLAFFAEERKVAIRKRNFYYWTTITHNYSAGNLVGELRGLERQLKTCNGILKEMGKVVDGADRKRVAKKKKGRRRAQREEGRHGGGGGGGRNVIRRQPRERHAHEDEASAHEEKVARGGRRGGKRGQFKQSRPRWNG